MLTPVFGPESRLEHAVGMSRDFAERLTHVTVLDDLAVLEPEDVHDRQSQFARPAPGVNMKDDEVSVDKDALDVAAQFRKLLLELMEKRAETVDAILDHRVMLDVVRPEMDGGTTDPDA